LPAGAADADASSPALGAISIAATATTKKKPGSSNLFSGSPRWLYMATAIVPAMNSPAARVASPSARRIPPANSDSPAIHALTTGKGMPISATDPASRAAPPSNTFR
jgi:hypothetical protein